MGLAVAPWSAVGCPESVCTRLRRAFGAWTYMQVMLPWPSKGRFPSLSSCLPPPKGEEHSFKCEVIVISRHRRRGDIFGGGQVLLDGG